MYVLEERFVTLSLAQLSHNLYTPREIVYLKANALSCEKMAVLATSISGSKCDTHARTPRWHTEVAYGVATKRYAVVYRPIS